MITRSESTIARALPLCNRWDFLLDRVDDRDVLSVGLGGQVGDTEYSFDLTAADLSSTFSAAVVRRARSATFVDISEAAIDAYQAQLPDADYFLADICSSPEGWPSELADRRFDHVVLGEVLEHLDSPGPALRSLQTVLRPGGTILITVPNSFYLSVFARMAKGEERVHPEHVAYYSPRTLTRLAEMSGLEITEIGFYRTRPLSVSQLRRNPLGYLSGWVAERLPQYGQGIVAAARPASSA